MDDIDSIYFIIYWVMGHLCLHCIVKYWSLCLKISLVTINQTHFLRYNVLTIKLEGYLLIPYYVYKGI